MSQIRVDDDTDVEIRIDEDILNLRIDGTDVLAVSYRVTAASASGAFRVVNVSSRTGIAAKASSQRPLSIRVS